MPLTLRPPRNGKTPNFEIRGTYLGVRVETSSGTHKRSVALAQLRKIEECIETHGQYPAPEPQADPGQPTFLSAAVAYMRDGGESRYVAFNLKHFRETLIKDIDQAALDTAAGELLSLAAPDYRNRKVYTPVIAILRHALGDKCPPFKRPAGSKGRERKDFMWPEDAFAIVDEAERIDPEFGLYLLLLLYAGIRKSEGINALKVDTRPEDLALWLRDSKNGDPRMLRLRQDVAERLQTHLKALPEGRERLFKFRDGDTSSICCCALRWPRAAWNAPSADRRDGSRQSSGFASSPSTFSATPGRPGCGCTAARTCKALPKPRTGAIHAASLDILTWSRGMSGRVWIVCRRRGISGEKQPMSEKD